MTHTQQSPYAIQIELTEGCNLRCAFCGINGIRTKKRQFKAMSISTAEQLSQMLKTACASGGWNPRLEFAMHGEPTMNPDWLDILAIFRRDNPSLNIMLTTNGGGLVNSVGKLEQALSYVNVVAVDAYEGVGIYQKLISKMQDAQIPFTWYPDDRSKNPHRRRKKSEANEVVFLRDISIEETGTHSVLNNHAGAAFPPNQKAEGKRCAKPFRELSIRWDGNIAICCNDWRGEYKVGNFMQYGSLEAVWNSERFDAARHYLYKGERSAISPCNGCDALTYRNGLLPDTMGKQTLPEPTARHAEIAREAIAGQSYTEQVVRPWET